MLNRKKKIQGLVAFTGLLLLAFGAGCKGFFVNPTLTSVAVGPQAAIQQGKTVQMTAVGTYDDGSTKNLTNVFWSSSATDIASISDTGLVTGITPGQVTITGSSGTVSGTNTVTVTLSGLTAITVTPANATITAGDSEIYKAMGTASGKQVDITDQVNWTVSNDLNGTVSIDTSGNLTTQTNSVTAQTTIQVIATDPTTGISGRTNLTINPAP
ncbi:MAG: Ig-like domain-containing protein [Acidobacteriia bacterium]|nr:Ig-like domain-containing protein [Terriglobia bacterium]